MKIGPLKFVPVYQEKIWGGRSLEQVYNRQLPEGKIGESWDISTHGNGASIVMEPKEVAGISLEDLCKKYPEQILGSVAKNGVFPLLVKIIDAADVLSVQVHPDDNYEKLKPWEAGKTEMWYVLAAEPNAKIIFGLKPGTTKEDFERGIVDGTLTNYLNEVPVQPGDYFYVPAGVVHALGAGIMVAEIQQSSDTVYRVFDWNRLDNSGQPRTLHIEQALDVIDFDFVLKPPQNKTGILVESPYFIVELLEFAHVQHITMNEGFEIITNLNQKIEIKYEEFNLILLPGDSCLIPACCGSYSINSQSESAKVLRTVPGDQ